MISVDEALDRIFAQIRPPETEIVPLGEAAGRVLAAPLVATHNQPPFDASAMDGYAVRSVDIAPGRALKLAGTSQAGARFSGMMVAGQCVRIFTGAPIPIGADTVVPQEDTTANGNEIGITAPVTPGQYVRLMGFDFARGTALLPPGTRLTPARLALAAAANQPRVTVARRRRIAVLATGDELLPVGAAPGPDQIISSNSFGLGALFAPYAAGILDLGIAPDDKSKIEEALLRAFDAGVDVLVTSGGASVGDRDLMATVLQDLGVSLGFWKLNLRPGKPLMFGTRGRTLIFGLPGNPVSSMVTATVLVLPALRQMLGLADPLGTRFHIPATEAIPANGPRRHFLRGALTRGGDGGLVVTPFAQTDSGHASSLAAADCLIVQPENSPGIAAGSQVEVIPLNWS